MAMQFNLPPAGTQLDAANALANLRQGFMVDRFTGLAVDRTLAGQAAAVDVLFGTGQADLPQINIAGNTHTITTPGSYHITDRVIYMNDTTAELLAAANGVHISFYNCTFHVEEYDNSQGNLRFPFGITPLATDGNRAASASVADGAAATRSVNFYGCTVTVSTQNNRTQLRVQLADAIGSDFRFAGTSITPQNGPIEIFPSPQLGGRWINSTFVTGQQTTAGRANLFTYGFPEVYEGVELYGLGIDNGHTATASGPRVLLEPNFTLLGADSDLFITQGNAQTGFSNEAQIFQNIGFFTPPDNNDNTDGDVINTGGNGGYVNIQAGGGGVINYAAYQPTYTDAVTGEGLQNVKVRVNSSVAIDDTATDLTVFQNRLINTGGTNAVTGNFYGNEYLTDTTGQLVSSMYTNDGWTTSNPGYFDPLIFDNRTAQGSTTLASQTRTPVDLDAPEHTALAVIQDIRGNATTQNFTRHQAQYQAFSWTHDIVQEMAESSGFNLDTTTRRTSTLYGINRDQGGSFPDLRGTVVKDGITTNVGTPDLAAIQAFFGATNVPSINDVRMAYRYDRWIYHVLGNPQTEFLNVTVDATAAALWLSSTGSIIVRGEGLAAKPTEDVFTSDTNIASLDMNSHPITGLTLGTRDVAGRGTPTLFSRLLHSDTEAAVTGGALTGVYVSHATGDITFDGVNVSQLDIDSGSGQVLNVRGTDHEGNRLSASSFLTVSGTVNFPAPVVRLTVQTPEEPGYFGVRNVTQNAVVKLPGTPVGENAVTTGLGNRGTYEIPVGNDVFRFYWKRANDSTTGYSTTIIERSNADLTMSMTETMSATPLIATLYSGDSRLGKANVADPSTASRAAGNNGMQILVDNNALTNGAESQYHILSAMDWPQYIDVLTANNRTTDLIAPDTVSSTVSDAGFIQFNTQTEGEQQQLVGAQFTNVNGIDNMLYERESIPVTDFAFVTSATQLTSDDRFFIRDRTNGNILPATGNTARWPGITNSAIQITNADLVAVDVGNNSALAVYLQALETRGFELASIGGQIQPRDAGGTRRADFSFAGITRTTTDTGTEYTFTLTQLNVTGTDNNILADQGFASGTTGTSLGGNTLTGAQSDQVVQITGTGFSFPSVTLFPNPAGATPAQIQQAAETAINGSTSIAQTRNGVGYLIGTGGDSRLVGIKPRATNYDPTQPYGDNL